MTNALQWFKANHKWYHHIQISKQRLSQLPEDDNLEDSWSVRTQLLIKGGRIDLNLIKD